MRIDAISIGDNPPHDVNVIIECPLGGLPIKYELDKASGALFVDRFLHTPMFYPCNYGFIPHTLSEDGDPVDMMVAGRMAVMPGTVLRARPVGVFLMEDEKGLDEKIIGVPHSSLSPYFHDIASYDQLPKNLIDQITHFFEHYKDLEPDKWVKVKGWGGVDAAIKLIEEGIARQNDAKTAQAAE